MFYVETSNLIFIWNKNSYRYLGNIWYLQFEDIWNLHLLSIFNHFLCSRLEPCEMVFLPSFIFCFLRPFQKSPVNSEQPSLAVFFSYHTTVLSIWHYWLYFSLSWFLKISQTCWNRLRLGPFDLLQILNKMKGFISLVYIVDLEREGKRRGEGEGENVPRYTRNLEISQC